MSKTYESYDVASVKTVGNRFSHSETARSKERTEPSVSRSGEAIERDYATVERYVKMYKNARGAEKAAMPQANKGGTVQ